jgi:glycyl-tRNA synthetase alpha subunit
MENKSILFSGPMSISQVQIFAQTIIEQVESGSLDALEVDIRCTYLMDALVKINKSIETLSLAEAEKHGKSFEYKNAKIQVKELGSKWHFDKSNDSKYFSIKSNIEKLDIERKDRETFLKSLKSKTSILDEETGELIAVFPPYKTSKTGVVITLKD